MKFDLITIFPEFFRGPLDYGIVRRAQEAGLVQIAVHDLRAFTRDRHRTVDDRPFGGGEGMVLKPEPIFECVESLGYAPREERAAVWTRATRPRDAGAGEAARVHTTSQGAHSTNTARETVVLLSPAGRVFDQALAQELAGLERIALICGRYEGVDERVAQHLADREISIGNYVLSGGELAAAIVVDAVTRLIPGALGNEASSRQESFTIGYTDGSAGVEAGDSPASSVPDSTCSSEGLLDYPHYTRPADFRGMKVPDVLQGGNHDQIRRWRREQARAKTERNRPDLLKGSF